MGFGVENTLKEFRKLIFGYTFFDFHDLIPYATVCKNLDDKIIEIDCKNAETGLIEQVGEVF